MDLSNFISGAGVSKWVPTVANPGFIQHINRQQKEQELLKEASTLVPDTAALSKALLEHDLPYADLAPRQAELQGMLNSYLEDYNKSPYNAFSREAKEKIKAMQYLVTDPHLKQLASENALFKKHTEKAIDADNLGNNLNVKDGQIGVWRLNEKGRPVLRYVDPDKVRVGKDGITTIAGDVDFINNKAGLSGLEGKYTIDMTSHKEVMDKIMKYFQGVGHTTLDQFNDGIGERVKSNSAQLDKAFQAIEQGAGLSQADWNTLYSEYYTKNLGAGPITKEQARAGILNDIKTFRDREEIGSDTAIKGTGAGTGAEGGPADLKAESDPWSLVWAGKTPATTLRESITEKVGDNVETVLSGLAGYKIPFYAEQTTAKGTRGVAEGQPSLVLGDNSFFKDSGTSYVVNPGTGAMEVQDMTQLKNSVVIDPSRDVVALALPVDEYGTPADVKMRQKIADYKANDTTGQIPKELEPYLYHTENGDVALRTGQFTAVPLIVPDRTSFVSKSVSDFVDQLKGAGYQKHDPTDQEQDIYSDHNHEGIDIDRGMVVDNILKPVLLVQAPSAERGRQLMGGNVKTSNRSVAVNTIGEGSPTIIRKNQKAYNDQVSQGNL